MSRPPIAQRPPSRRAEPVPRPQTCRHLPTTDELLVAPDVAILDALGAAIDVAIVAVVAQQPELWPSADRRDAVCTREGETADEVIRSAQALAVAIAIYRSIVTSRRI